MSKALSGALGSPSRQTRWPLYAGGRQSARGYPQSGASCGGI